VGTVWEIGELGEGVLGGAFLWVEVCGAATAGRKKIARTILRTDDFISILLSWMVSGYFHGESIPLGPETDIRNP